MGTRPPPAHLVPSLLPRLEDRRDQLRRESRWCLVCLGFLGGLEDLSLLGGLVDQEQWSRHLVGLGCLVVLWLRQDR